MPDWIDEEFERMADGAAEEPTDDQVSQFVLRWWQQLANGIKHDLERVRERDIAGEFSEPKTNVYEVRNAAEGLLLRIELDPEARTVHFDYEADGRRAAAPEGGFFSLRTRGHARVVAYYADQPLSQDELLRTLLKPVLFPAVPTEEAA